ncbi:MAG TPA: monovalent cation/H(+) antiporter subunit G [Longimicrobiales bacterium]|nr:monovalent cation/H(+) antiporter subunit G [Longimicrobiales bacterium]
MRDVLVAAAVSAGAFFFLAGTVGLLRFPDVFSRLHALTKADNLGLGLIVLGLALHAASWLVALKLVITWLLVLGATATTCHLIARTALERGLPRRGPGGEWPHHEPPRSRPGHERPADGPRPGGGR